MNIAEIEIDRQLKELNELFLHWHDRRKKQALDEVKKSIPVLFVNGDNLVLLHHDERREFPYMPKVYHQLKTVAHVPCGLHDLDVVLQDDVEEARKEYLEQVQKVITSLDAAPEHPLKPFCGMLKDIQKEVVGARKIEASAGAFRADTAHLIDEAARVRLDNLDRVTEEVRQKIGDEAWRNVAVIVLGPQLPREGDIAMQYFSDILQIDIKPSRCPFLQLKMSAPNRQRLIYAESLSTEEASLNLLASHIADEELGRVFLDDPLAMHKDVTADAGARHLKKLLSSKH